MVNNYSEPLEWTTEAKNKLRNIPYFVRTQARQRIEQIAHDMAVDLVTVDIVEKAKIEFGQ